MERGFTLVELAIVLVIIGLLVGGVLVGRDLIAAAAVRGQISQFRQFDQGVAAFRLKYGGLPGDLPTMRASQYGFVARGPYMGQGNGDGVLEGNYNNASGTNCGYKQGTGEVMVFWVDLSTAGMIPGQFTVASETVVPGPDITLTTTPGIADYYPAARIGGGNYIYIYMGGSGASCSGGTSDGYVWYGISLASMIGGASGSGTVCQDCLLSSAGLSVRQAYDLDSKMDDGLPLKGAVQDTAILNNSPTHVNGAATTHTVTTCYAASIYSVSINDGTNINCGLSVRMTQ